jgi:hypothetical protein
MRKVSAVCPLRVGEVKGLGGGVQWSDIVTKDGALVAKCVDADWAEVFVSWSRVAPELGRLMRTLQEYEDGLLGREAAFERMRGVLIGARP